ANFDLLRGSAGHHGFCSLGMAISAQESGALETQPCTALVASLSTGIRVRWWTPNSFTTKDTKVHEGSHHSAHLNQDDQHATLEPETNTTVKPIAKILYLAV